MPLEGPEVAFRAAWQGPLPPTKSQRGITGVLNRDRIQTASFRPFVNLLDVRTIVLYNCTPCHTKTYLSLSLLLGPFLNDTITTTKLVVLLHHYGFIHVHNVERTPGFHQGIPTTDVGPGRGWEDDRLVQAEAW